MALQLTKAEKKEISLTCLNIASHIVSMEQLSGVIQFPSDRYNYANSIARKIYDGYIIWLGELQ